MNTEQYFKKKYADLIWINPIRYPKYEIIHFKKWIELELKGANILEDYKLQQMREIIKEEYGNELYWERAELKRIRIKDLYFYQDNISITGPRHTALDEPVKVIDFSGKLILENGYHRLAAKVIKGNKTIYAMVLDI